MKERDIPLSLIVLSIASYCNLFVDHEEKENIVLTFLGGQIWGVQELCGGTKANLLKGLSIPCSALKSWNQNLLSSLVSS